MEKYICPVCGYSELDEPPYDLETNAPSFNICPCCGCEYGYDDATPQAKTNYRKKWIAQGANWFKPDRKPVSWDLELQLKRIGLRLNDI